MTGPILFGALGWCAVLLALAGAMLPGLPSTVFVIVASYCFARSSPRFGRWLRSNRWLGPSLRHIDGGGMPPAAKRAALIAMWVAVLVSAGVLAGTHLTIAAATLGLGVVGTVAILFGVRTI